MIGAAAIGLTALCGCQSGDKTSSADGNVTRQGRNQPSPVKVSLCAAGMPTQWMWKCDPVFVDVNMDGLTDLAALPRLGDGPHVWLGDGNGGWTDSSNGLSTGENSCGGGLAFADINKDGNLDLAVGDHCQGAFVYLGDGKGGWTMVTSGLAPRELSPNEENVQGYVGTEDIDLGDINRDGNLDIISISNDSGGVNVFIGDGTGKNWTRHSSPGLPTTNAANRVSLVDINKDGMLDAVVAYQPGPRVWLGDGKGNWTEASKGLPSPQLGGLYRGTAIGDINEDGLLDIATANWIDGPEVYLQQADGSWQQTPHVTNELTGGAVGLALGDIDQDGHLDMIYSGRVDQSVGYVYGVFMLLGNGKGEWTLLKDTGLPDTGLAFTWGVALGDINGDGTLDMAAGSGGIVATAPGRTEPIIPEHVPVWCTTLNKSAKTAR